jgi:hypothetical protein
LFYRVWYLRCCPFRWYMISYSYLTFLSLNMHFNTYTLILTVSLHYNQSTWNGILNKTGVNVHNLAQSGINVFGAAIMSPLFKSIDLTKGNRPRGFWSSLLIWQRGYDCSFKDVFTRLRQFALFAKLCTFTLSRGYRQSCAVAILVSTSA